MLAATTPSLKMPTEGLSALCCHRLPLPQTPAEGRLPSSSLSPDRVCNLIKQAFNDAIAELNALSDKGTRIQL